MAELIGDVYRGDSWNFPGGKDTQILATHSEDMSSDSPTQAKVEEQSSFKRSLASEQIRHDGEQHASTHSATLPSETGTAAAEIASGAVVDVASSHLPVTFSNSSNSSACCMPSLGAQAGPSYDISASARGAEQRLHNGSAPQANATQYSRLGQDDYMRTNLQPQAALPSFAVQSSLASVFDDVDSGRHQQAGLESAQLGHGQISHHRRRVAQQDSLPSAYRSFFPEDSPSLQSQQQLNRQQLLQLLPPQLQERHDPQVAHHQHMHQLPGHQPQQMSFSNLTNLHQPINGMSFNQLSPDMQQWPSPVSQRASSSRAMQPGDAAASRQPIKLEDLDLSDLSGLKRDFSSFTSPTSQPRQPRPPPRRALSFTQGSLASAASTAAVGTAAARRTQGGPNNSQAASHSRLSTPASNVTSPPDTDASLSDSDEMSGSDSGGIKRRRVLKGKRGGGRRPRRMVCRNCNAHQTPQWRCGPDGPRTLCNACGVRFKKGLPLTGVVKVAEGSSS